jgi:NTE family protein
MPPIPWNGRLLVDGGIANPVPADLAGNIGADVVIAVDVGLGFSPSTPIKDGIDAITRTREIMSCHLSLRGRESADILIEPAVKKVNWAEFMSYTELIRQGEKAAAEQVANIKKLIAHPLRRLIMMWTRRLVRGRKRTLMYPSSSK